MIKNIEQVWIIVLLMITLPSCSNLSDEASSHMEEKFMAAVPIADMNKSLEVKTYKDQKDFPLGSDIAILVENKSSHFLFFDLASNQVRLFMFRNAEWVQVKNGITGSGSRVLSPAQGPPLLNLDATSAQPVLDDNVFKDNKSILIRVVITGEIMKMDAYSSSWRDHEDEILTGELVAGYIDVYVTSKSQQSVTQKLPNTACTRRVGVCAFLGSLRGLKWVPAKWHCLIPPTRG